MSISLFQVDSFTDQAFGGNPAGVCLLDEVHPDAWMAGVAREMNLSETAFLLPEGEGYRLRWFTPKVEVTLCGHATLASAHILWEQGILAPDAGATFETLSGRLRAHRLDGGWIALDFPTRPVEPVTAPEGLLKMLGINSPVFVGRYKEDYLIELAEENQVRDAQPDFQGLLKVKTRGVVLTAASSTPQFDFVSRFFAPAVGVNEDPVTGSAHCALTPYWSAKLGKPVLDAYQASERGGVLRVRALGERVSIEGQATTIFEAKLLI